ncbi:LOW QUALITY PROTEIN: rac GTPase-activating protein 1-like [Clytia hemisphaerica]
MKKTQRSSANSKDTKKALSQEIMAGSVVKKYDELIRCTNVLTEGIETEFVKFVKHQEDSRKKWQHVEEENHEMKKYMAKYKASKDTLDIQLNMARHQLDAEIKKRLKAEQSVDHMARQLQLIKELLLDKDGSGDTKLVFDKLQQQINDTVGQRVDNEQQADLINQSYTLDESSFDLPASEYDNTEDDILDLTGGSVLGNGRRRSNKRGLPTAPPLNEVDSTESELSTYQVKKTRVSEEKPARKFKKKRTRYYVPEEKVYRQVHKTIETHVTVTGGRSPAKSPKKAERLDKDFSRPPSQSGKRPPSRGHVRAQSTTDMSDEYDKENCSTPRPFTLTRHQQQQPPLQPKPENHHSNNRHHHHQSFQHPSPSKPPINKGLTKQMTVPNLYPNLDSMLTPDPKKKFNTLNTQGLAKSCKLINLFPKLLFVWNLVGPCNKKVRFGSHISKCKECKAMCHNECRDKVPLPCIPSKDTPGRKREGAIESYISGSGLQVPKIVTTCIEEVEKRGLRELGIYRVPGMDRDVKELKEKFLRGRNPDLNKINDIHVVCGCLKDFLRGLSEPLVTFTLHESFMVSAALTDEDDSLSGMYQCVSELPQANRETLAAIVIHLQKVATSTETQMSVSNLSKVFGPTLIGHRSSNPTHMEMLDDTKAQPVVVTRLLEMPSDYWSQLLSGGPHVRTPPYNPHYASATPTTPECKPVPTSRLGAIDDMTPSRSDRKFNAMNPRHASSKDPKSHRFFNSPS